MKSGEHRKRLEHYATHPQELGIYHVVCVSIEEKLYEFRGGRRRLVAEPDLHFVCEHPRGETEHYIVEYKGNNRKELTERAQKQLANAVLWFNKRGIAPKTLIVNGNTRIKKPSRIRHDQRHNL